jgi:hypothetical protein
MQLTRHPFRVKWTMEFTSEDVKAFSTSFAVKHAPATAKTPFRQESNSVVVVLLSHSTIEVKMEIPTMSVQ